MDPGSVFFLVLVIGAMYYLLLRPQQKREKARRELVRSLEVGDEVVTNAGIHGVVAEVEAAIVWIEVAPDVELKVSRDAIAAKVAETADEDAEPAVADDDSADG